MMIAAKTFSMDDQVRFATLSGDRNPLHMDSVAARRTVMGAPVVHGVHGVLWALESLCASEPLAIRRLSASFAGPIYLGETARVEIVRRRGDQLRLLLSVEGTPATTLTIGLGDRTAGPPPAPIEAERGDWPPSPVELSLAELPSRAGAFLPAADAGAAFPAASGVIGADRVNGLAALSRLVGMVCPGLHSLFHSFSVDLVDPVHPAARYGVSDFDPRFGLTRMTVSGLGLDGEVAAFVRSAPVAQPSIGEISGKLEQGAFADAIVLVVGGSRGLGEVTAKACAAGGARVIITYATGAVEAARVADEIRAFGGACETLALDVRGDVAGQLHGLTPAPTHLYYFATGPIAARKTRFLNADILADLMRIYATGFLEVCEAVKIDGQPLKVFYPSSTAVEAAPKGWTEYAMAKAAGEVLCENMSLRMKGVSVLSRRLPRILTDQTATILSAEAAPVLSVILPIVDEMQG